jgi:hypothetical protein
MVNRTVQGGDGFDWDAYEAELSGIDPTQRRAPRHEPEPDGDQRNRRQIPDLTNLYDLPPHWGRLRRGDQPE